MYFSFAKIFVFKSVKSVESVENIILDKETDQALSISKSTSKLSLLTIC